MAIDKNMKVLVVDDFDTVRRIVKGILKQLGFTNIVEAEDGEKALDELEKEGANFGLIVSDWNMPNMDGLTLLKKIRGKNISTPVIMVTTEAEKPRIIEAIKAGANNYLVKPFTPDALQAKIEETLKKASAPA